MRKIVGIICFLPLTAVAQKVVIQPVDIIYGNQVIHSHHQVVLDSPEKVDIIPAQKQKPSLTAPNVVVTATGNDASYLENKAIAAREKAIYDEVNKRTQDAPFTVLFTGHIPDDIQEKRLRMLPEIGMFGDQLNKLEKNRGVSADSTSQNDTSKGAIKPNAGDFTEVSPAGISGSHPGSTSGTPASNNFPKPTATQQQKLDKLIGGG